ncbi:MAG: GUN4 domain-containing protein [Pleurocapsa minor HA4230-MV1]|jgi:S1-C subfamily serine protease|nr:GUN4 domain-containing protein [Pleurocapsa minor HA4230-MV1]
MKFKHKITQLTITGAVSSILASGILLSAIATQQTQAEVSQLAQALAPEEVNLRAKQIVVRIDGANVGSGSILEYQDGNYTVLTNWHVMKNQGSYTVQTIDGRKHQVIASSIKQLPGVDLAIFQFSSDQNYQTAELGDSGSLSEGQIVYFAGYPGELRREDNRYYRFFTANIVGILPKSTANGYSLIYSGEAFPGMSGGPVFSRDGVMIGIHGEANVNAISGGTSNYAIPIVSYQQAIAKLEAQPTAQNPPAATPKPEVAAQQPATKPAPPAKTPVKPTAPSQPSPINSNNVSSVPTFGSGSKPATKPASKPEVIVETEAEQPVEQPKPASKPEVIVETEAKPNQPEQLEEVSVTSTTKKIALISPKTGIDYTKLRDLLKEGKWSEADLHTYQLVEQIIKSAKNDNQHIFIELKTIAEYSCPDVRTVDYLWKKYSNNQFGFSPQQQVWQNVNQDGDFSTQTWRRFATEVGWKKGEVANGSGYLLYDELDFEPSKAPAGHLPWWFALPDEEQNVIKSLFARCNLNPTTAELEAEAKANSADTAQNPGNNVNSKNQPDINKPPKSKN